MLVFPGQSQVHPEGSPGLTCLRKLFESALGEASLFSLRKKITVFYLLRYRLDVKLWVGSKLVEMSLLFFISTSISCYPTSHNGVYAKISLKKRMCL